MPTTDVSRRLRAVRRVLAAMAVLSLTFAVGVAPAATDRQAAKVVRSSGSSVAEVQRALGIPADGIYGPQTRRAVRRFMPRPSPDVARATVASVLIPGWKRAPVLFRCPAVPCCPRASAHEGTR